MLQNVPNLPERPQYCSGKHCWWMKVSKFDITSLCVCSCPPVDSLNWTSKQSLEQWRHHTHIHSKTHPIPPILKMHRFMLRYCCKIHWTPLKKKMVLDLNEYYKSSIPRNLNLFYLFTSIDWLDQELEVRHLDPRCVSLWPQRKANKPAVDKNGRNGPMNREVGLWMSRQLNLSKIGTRNNVEIILGGKFRNGIVRRISRSTSKCA